MGRERFPQSVDEDITIRKWVACEAANSNQQLMKTNWTSLFHARSGHTRFPNPMRDNHSHCACKRHCNRKLNTPKCSRQCCQGWGNNFVPMPSGLCTEHLRQALFNCYWNMDAKWNTYINKNIRLNNILKTQNKFCKFFFQSLVILKIKKSMRK